jgi:hypothetical protein
VVAPAVAGILLMRSPCLRRRPLWHLAVWLPILAGIAVYVWFTARPDSVPLAPILPSPVRLFLRCFQSAIYLGLSGLPLVAMRPGVASRRRFLIALVVLLDCAFICALGGWELSLPYAHRGGLFPYLPNTVSSWGTLDQGVDLAGERPVMIGTVGQVFLTLAGCVGAAVLVDRAGEKASSRALFNPLVIFTVFHALLPLVSPTLFDRYLIVLMPGALAVAATAEIDRKWVAGLAVLGVFAACSLGLMHDWLAWNSARWELGRRALARGIPADEIEGGFEWNGWYAPGPVASERTPYSPSGLTLPFNHFRHPHITGRYALAFSEVAGTVVRDSEPYRLWLVAGARRCLLLEQKQPAEAVRSPVARSCCAPQRPGERRCCDPAASSPQDFAGRSVRPARLANAEERTQQNHTRAQAPQPPDRSNGRREIASEGSEKSRNMRAAAAALIAVSLLGVTGCNSEQLRFTTLRLGRTIPELQERQVIDNLARLAADPERLPYYTVINQGTANIQDTGSAGVYELNFQPHVGTLASLNGSVSRQVTGNWSLNPMSNPDRLRAMRAAYQTALGVPFIDPADAKRLKAVLSDQTDLAPAPAWVAVGRKHDVPKEACRVAHCGKTYVWVMPEHAKEFSDFALLMLNIATWAPPAAPVKAAATAAAAAARLPQPPGAAPPAAEIAPPSPIQPRLYEDSQSINRGLFFIPR